MKQLTFDQNSNLGGLQCVYAIPESSFVRIWRDYTHNLNYLRVKNRDDIIDIYITELDGIFRENADNGVYKVELSGVVPKSNPLNSKQLIRLETEYWIVLFRDNNDYWRLAGNEENKMKFARIDNSGQLGQRNQLEFTFSSNQRKSCVFIELAEIEDL